jgi:hypothetical protein
MKYESGAGEVVGHNPRGYGCDAPAMLPIIHAGLESDPHDRWAACFWVGPLPGQDAKRIDEGE